MYAIVQSGGKQYKVAVGRMISVEKLDVKVGDKIKLEVLMASNDGKVSVGNPLLKNASVEAEVVNHYKGDKVVVYKFKAKKNVRSKQGHRQPYTTLKVLSINV